MKNALNSRYKERIEFEYDIVVAIAKDNATPRHVQVETKLKSLLGVDVPVQLNFDFTKDMIFKGDFQLDFNLKIRWIY